MFVILIAIALNIDANMNDTSTIAVTTTRTSSTVKPCTNLSPFGINKAATTSISAWGSTRIVAEIILEKTIELLLIGDARNLPIGPLKPSGWL